MQKLTLLKRWIGMIIGRNNVAVKQGPGKYYSKSEIKGYYNDLTGKVNEKTLLDKNGIPVNEIGGGVKVYFPISIFQYALGLWDLYLEKQENIYAKKFLNICEWIINNQRKDGSWDCFGPIGYKSISVSSMGQGEAISVLCRAYILTNKSCYLESLKNAAIFLKKDIKYGGVMRADSEDVVFEEYASVNSEKISVLNGWIFTLFGLFDYIKLIPDLKYEKLLYASVLTLEKYLQCYDCGYWSMYDLSGRIASPAYHDLHIDLLYVMSDLTDIDSFSKYAEKWSKYKESNLNKFKAIVRKIGQKLLESSEGVVIQ